MSLNKFFLYIRRGLCSLFAYAHACFGHCTYEGIKKEKLFYVV